MEANPLAGLYCVGALKDRAHAKAQTTTHCGLDRVGGISLIFGISAHFFRRVSMVPKYDIFKKTDNSAVWD
jgi:hypothetical protein